MANQGSTGIQEPGQEDNCEVHTFAPRICLSNRPLRLYPTPTRLPCLLQIEKSLMPSFILIPVFIPCPSFWSWGSRSCPQFLIHNPKFLIKELFSPVRKIFFSYWENDFLRAFQSHNKGTTSAGGNHTIQYVAVRFHTISHVIWQLGASWRFAQVIHDEPYLA